MRWGDVKDGQIFKFGWTTQDELSIGVKVRMGGTTKSMLCILKYHPLAIIPGISFNGKITHDYFRNESIIQFYEPLEIQLGDE